MAGIHGNYELETNGLVLCLDATHPRSYPGSGTIVYNIAGKGEEGLLNPNSTFSTSNNGLFIYSTNNSDFNVLPSLQLSSWFRLNNFSIVTVVRADNLDYPQSAHPLTINHTVYGTGYPGWSVGHRTSKDFTEVRCCDGPNYVTVNINHPTANYITSSTMYHRVFTVDRTSGCLTHMYINGLYIGSANAPSVSGSIFETHVVAALDAGHRRGLNFGNVWGWRFVGGISQIMVFNRVLTQEEIIKNYNATKRRLRF